MERWGNCLKCRGTGDVETKGELEECGLCDGSGYFGTADADYEKDRALREKTKAEQRGEEKTK